MELEMVVVAVVMTAVVAAGITLSVILLSRTREVSEKWHHLNAIVPFHYTWVGGGALPFTEELLVQRFNWAFECILKNGPWNEGRLKWALADVQIIIGNIDQWKDSNGELVTGRTWPDQGMMKIGSSLKALCHELCHFASSKLDDGDVDYAHKTWALRGLKSAEQMYLGG